MAGDFPGLASYLIYASGPRTQRRNWDKANKWDPLQLVVMFFCNKHLGEMNRAPIQGVKGEQLASQLEEELVG